MDQFDVSIVLPVYNRWDLTRSCLQSIRRSANHSRLRAEVIVTDDASPEDIQAGVSRLPESKWPVRYRRNPTNLGFLENVNAAAQEARGRLLCTVNSDTLLPVGWLDELVATLEGAPDVGAVGPAFVDPRGRLRECGCMVRSDGEPVVLGREREGFPGPPYDYLNDVDYVSGACLLLRTEAFRGLGGFDAYYGRGYYEDVDLCFRLAERGERVLVNPAVRVSHVESASFGGEGTRAAMEANRLRFVGRWAARLRSRHPGADAPVARVRTWRRRGTVAFHAGFVPAPDGDAAARRAWHLVRELRRQDYHVVFGCPGSHSDPDLLKLRHMGVETVTAGPEEPTVRQEVAELEPLAAVFCGPAAEQQYGGLYHDLSPRTARLLAPVDLSLAREAERPTPLTAGERGVEELAAAARCHGAVVASPAERNLLSEGFAFDPRRLFVIGTAHEPAAERAPRAQREGFACVADPGDGAAISWLVQEVWPLVRREVPDAQLAIYGAGAATAPHDPARGVHAVGPAADVREALARAAVVLAPQRSATGHRDGTLETLAVGTPVVTTLAGAAALGDAGRDLPAADGPEEFARRAVELYRDAAGWERHSAAGVELVARQFTPAAAVAKLLEAAREAGALRPQPEWWHLVSRMLWRADALGRENRRELAAFRDGVMSSRSWAFFSKLNRLLRRGA